MTDYKLTYFDVAGGRGEPIRIALHAAGIAFDDIRWTFPQFGEKRSGLRFQAVPVLEMDGATITQSNAISRFIGKQCGLYPSDDLQAMYCDEVMEAIEDLTHYVVQTFGLSGDELKAARESLMHGRMTTFLRGLDELLTRGGGKHFANQCLTVADLKVFVMLKNLRSGNLDHIPGEFVDQLTPNLAAFAEHMAQLPQVVAYYESLG